MSKLADLKNKGQKVILSNGLEIELKPMSLGDEAEVAELQMNKQTFKAVSYMVKQAIKKAIPDATDEEIDDLNKDDLKVVTEKVLELNGLGQDDKKKSEKTSHSKKE
jgi:TRAP-type C4-dicarboxylate transport system substrate-binding protein